PDLRLAVAARRNGPLAGASRRTSGCGGGGGARDALRGPDAAVRDVVPELPVLTGARGLAPAMVEPQCARPDALGSEAAPRPARARVGPRAARTAVRSAGRSLDGTAPGPGPILTPNVKGIHGLLDPDPHYPYLVAEPGIEPAGSIVARHEHRAGGGFQTWTLYRVREPLRLRYAVTGLFADGWSGPYDTAYTRYSTAGGRAGSLRVRVSWEQWPGP